MCFILADPIAEAEGIDTEAQACIVFACGAFDGQLRLAATTGFLIEASSALLGIEADEVDVPGDTEASLLELANVLGGELVSLLGGESQQFDFGIPGLGGEAWSDADETVRLAFDSMGETLLVEFDRRGAAASR